MDPLTLTIFPGDSDPKTQLENVKNEIRKVARARKGKKKNTFSLDDVPLHLKREFERLYLRVEKPEVNAELLKTTKELASLDGEVELAKSKLEEADKELVDAQDAADLKFAEYRRILVSSNNIIKEAAEELVDEVNAEVEDKAPKPRKLRF